MTTDYTVWDVLLLASVRFVTVIAMVLVAGWLVTAIDWLLS